MTAAAARSATAVRAGSFSNSATCRSSTSVNRSSPSSSSEVLDRQVAEFEKEFKKPEMKLGILDGAVLSADKLKAIADIPSREAVLSQLLGTILEPAASIARVIKAKFNPDEDGASEEAPAEAAAE